MKKQYNLATPPQRGGTAMLTMDAAAVSSGLAFLESELEKLDPLLLEPLTSRPTRATSRSRAAAAGSRRRPRSTLSTASRADRQTASAASVSIHAPRAGRDIIEARERGLGPVSIHAPRAGRDDH